MYRFRFAVLALLLLSLPGGSPARAETRELELTWSELAPRITRRDVKAILADSTSVQGEVIAVTENALRLSIMKTSNPKAHPKGRAEFSESAVSAFEFNDEGSEEGERIGQQAGMVEGLALGAVVVERYARFGSAAPIAILGGSVIAGGVIGRALGRHLDRIIVRIKVFRPAAVSETQSPPQSSSPAEATTESPKVENASQAGSEPQLEGDDFWTLPKFQAGLQRR